MTDIREQLRQGARALYKWGNVALAAIEVACVRRARLETPPVFIIGPPRSGSTLLYQCLVNTLDFGYLANVHGLVYGAPTLVEHLTHATDRPRNFPYRSEFGRTRGAWSPSECGEFWYRFFRKNPQYVSAHHVTDRKKQELRNVIATLSRIMKRPLLIKNMPNALRLGPLAQALPSAVYLVTRRQELATARSILGARLSLHGNYERWWSMAPPRTDGVRNLPPTLQVLEQIRSVYDEIDTHREKMSRDLFLDVSYESFCANPGQQIARIKTYLESHGIAVPYIAPPPDSFPHSSGTRLPADMEAQLAEHAQPRE
jgi:hypothetical protein